MTAFGTYTTLVQRLALVGIWMDHGHSASAALSCL
jgi:hypothetical protein